ncbi:hypothetical protein FOG50_03321 [Hanseniaspora uvarum]|uniref:Secretory component protein SHR3 n=1 Tax=Hanseniaspora uvarum TaxID=29833 RepID=A0A1E5RQZ1_HANUV|nr:hypothetical protein FOG48_02647 [Hanseniaspora uvarum]KAF0275833.1 hypothetical protein FOG50_03321 [Hanseniaspora uvarum]OEJ89319.1 Secretory component protein SHR3 [Hanseniaspora uvarum]
MAFITFKDVEDISLILINFTTFTLLGMVISQWNYDIPILFDQEATASKFDSFLTHYNNFNSISKSSVIVYGIIYGVGLFGAIIRIVNPHPDYQLFEYGTFVLLFLFVCVFLTNVKTGIETCKHRNWGDVSENQGLQVLAASNLILLAIIVGIVILQGGMWYTKWEYQKRLTAHNLEIKKEEQEKLAKQQEKDVPPVATTTATVPKTKGKAKSKK